MDFVSVFKSKISHVMCHTHPNEFVNYLDMNRNLQPVDRVLCVKCDLGGQLTRSIEQVELAILEFNKEQQEQKLQIFSQMEQLLKQNLEHIQELIKGIYENFELQIIQLKQIYIQEDLYEKYYHRAHLTHDDLQLMASTLSRSVMIENQKLKIKSKKLKDMDINILKEYINHTQKLINTIPLSQKDIIFSIKPQRCQQLTHNNHEIESLVLNKAENQVILSTSDHNIHIYELEVNKKWKQIQLIQKAHSDFITSIIFSKRRNQFISTGKDKTIKIWRCIVTAEWSLFQTLTEHTSWVKDIQFDSTEDTFASCGDDQTIKIWNNTQGKWALFESLKVHQNYVYSVSFNKDNALLASGSGDKTIIVWHLEYNSWKLKQQLIGHKEDVNKVAFCKKSNILCSGGWDNKILIWDIKLDGEYHLIQELHDHEKQIKTIVFNPLFNLFLSTAKDKSIKIWKQQKDGLFTCNQTIQCTSDSKKLIFSEDFQSLYTFTMDSIVIYKCRLE